jgi:hypothetical protein
MNDRKQNETERHFVLKKALFSVLVPSTTHLEKGRN